LFSGYFNVFRLFEDTVECEDIYETMKRDIARFDTSDYLAFSSGHSYERYASREQKSRKDENNGAIMIEFVGLRARMYVVRIDGKKGIKKAKDVKQS